MLSIQTFKKIHNLDYRAGVVEKRIEKLKKKGVKTKELENALRVVGDNLKKKKLEKAEKRLLGLESGSILEDGEEVVRSSTLDLDG